MHKHKGRWYEDLGADTEKTVGKDNWRRPIECLSLAWGINGNRRMYPSFSWRLKSKNTDGCFEKGLSSMFNV